MTKIKNKNLGFGLVEIIIGASILSVGIVAILTSYTVYIKYALSHKNDVSAAYLLEEGSEAMFFLRDKSWSANIASLSTTTTYYLTFNSSYWATTTVPQYVDGKFLRSINIYDIKRNASDQISTTTGTYDPNTKQIITTVSYFQGNATTTQTVTTYISNI